MTPDILCSGRRIPCPGICRQKIRNATENATLYDGGIGPVWRLTSNESITSGYWMLDVDFRNTLRAQLRAFERFCFRPMVSSGVSEVRNLPASLAFGNALSA